MTNLPNHQLAGDARHPFSFGGAGAGPITVESNLATVNMAIDSSHKIYKFAKAGYVNQFAIKTSVLMDSHTTPTLTFDVGTAADDDEFIAGSTAALAFAGDLTNTASTGTATEAGFLVAADSYVILSIKAAAATAVAGTVSVSFKYTAL